MRRAYYLQKIRQGLSAHPVLLLNGPCASGKTVIVRDYVAEQTLPPLYIDLARQRFPERQLYRSQLMIVHNGHYQLELLSQLIDNWPQLAKARLIMIGALGRTTVDRIVGYSEVVKKIDILPLSLLEVDDWQKLWLEGGLPEIYCQADQIKHHQWRDQYVDRALASHVTVQGIQMKTNLLKKVLEALAPFSARRIDKQSLANQLGIRRSLLEHCLWVLQERYLVMLLADDSQQQWAVYFRDTGILHKLWGIVYREALLTHAARDYSWKTFVTENLIRYFEAKAVKPQFRHMGQDSVLDLIVDYDNSRIGFSYDFEFMFTPHADYRSMYQRAIARHQLDLLYRIYPGQGCFPLAKQCYAYSVSEYFKSTA
jgi:predicted AAA+ superfamily ATPase